MDDPRRALPAIDVLIASIPQLRDAEPGVARWIARRVVDDARAGLDATGAAGVAEAVSAKAAALAELLFSPTVRAINATGVLLHTNLGRAPLATRAIEAGVAASGATPVELDRATGERGGRGRAVGLLAAALTGAEAGLVVNNNAAALVLILAALASRREVLVSRGELIEIGGSFRLPDILAASGAILREVGTTNRTRLEDFRDALGPRSALLLRAHPSNYRVEGFVAAPSVAEMVSLAREASVPLALDPGSGLLETHPGFPDEPDVRAGIEAGADLVCFSGDKLLGGPQAGIIVGRAEHLAVLARHPFARAVRPGKVVLAQLEATLQLHATGNRGEIPFWSALETPLEVLRERAREMVAGFVGVETEEAAGVVGGGSAPGHEFPSIVLRLPGSAGALADALRAGPRPVIGRIDRGAVVLDLRTVDPSDLVVLRARLREVLEGPNPTS